MRTWVCTCMPATFQTCPPVLLGAALSHLGVWLMRGEGVGGQSGVGRCLLLSYRRTWTPVKAEDRPVLGDLVTWVTV